MLLTMNNTRQLVAWEQMASWTTRSMRSGFLRICPLLPAFTLPQFGAGSCCAFYIVHSVMHHHQCSHSVPCTSKHSAPSCASLLPFWRCWLAKSQSVLEGSLHVQICSFFKQFKQNGTCLLERKPGSPSSVKFSWHSNVKSRTAITEVLFT